MQKTKILIVADVLGEQNNGTTLTITRLINGLKSKNFDVTILSPMANDPKNGYYALKKRNFFVFNSYVKKNGVCLGVPNKKLLTSLISNADIVHIVLPFKVGKMAIKICKQLSKPFTAAFHCPAEAVTVHLGLKNNALANNIVYKYHYNHFYKYCKTIHCPSQFYANILRKKGYKNDLKVISNGVSDAFFLDFPTKNHQFFDIITVGRLSLEKRQSLLIDAVAMSKYNNRIRVIIAGDGPIKSKLQKQSKKLANLPIIEYIPSEQLPSVLHNCNLYVHCSDVEVEGTACLEAIASGLVPIISDSPKSATRDFALSNHCLFKNGNAQSLCNQIEYFFEHPDQITYHKHLYRDFIQKFHSSVVTDQMSQMFLDVLSSKDNYENNFLYR